ncbi:hypothetical protein FQR65_LT08065 [Abscondita terminalis]|nr:hypothetical protein FQR65_LT08065 [Abscondita terminalis]
MTEDKTENVGTSSGKIVYQKVTTTTITRFGEDDPTKEEVRDALLMYNLSQGNVDTHTVEKSPITPAERNAVKNIESLQTTGDVDKIESASDEDVDEKDEGDDRNESLKTLRKCIEAMSTEDIMTLTKTLQLQLKKEEENKIPKSLKGTMSAQEQQEYIKYIGKKMNEMSQSNAPYVRPNTNTFDRSNFVFNSTGCSQPSNIIGNQCGKANYKTQGTSSQGYLSNNYQSLQQPFPFQQDNTAQGYQLSQQPHPFFQGLSTNYELPKTEEPIKQRSEEDCVCCGRVLPILTMSNTNRNPSPTVTPIKSYETKTVTKTPSGGTVVKKIHASTIITSTPAQGY